MKKDMPVFGIYEKALKPQSFGAMFADAKSAGYDTFELSIDCTDERLARLNWGKKEIQEVRDAALEHEIDILTMCLSGHKRYPLGSPDPQVVKTGMEMMEKAIDLAGGLGIRVIQLSGFDVYDEKDRTPQTRERYVENIRRAVKMAEQSCVTLAIEPVEGNLLTVKDTMEVVRAIPSPFLQVYPDVANILSLGIDPIEDLTYGKGHIAAVHMRDSLPYIYDATLLFGTGNLDFAKVFEKLDEMEYGGPFIVEMWNTERLDYQKYIRQAREYMEEQIKKVRSRACGSKEAQR
ncbi:MAG: L-ribulose-5-phosphate 3-epimerase [Eubacteriales bacterium]|nr:L-ribulose-5-phosphate 3-epimerase [Eubacteriales bacterium]